MTPTDKPRQSAHIWAYMGGLVLSVLMLFPAYANEGVGDLLREGRLRVTTHITKTQTPLYVTQPVVIHVEVATQGRFNRGTQIRGFHVADAITLPPPAFAVNATRLEAGTLWAVQTWTLTLYPLKDKKYLLPALSLEVGVVDRDGGEKSGVVKTQPQTFSSVLPPSAAEKMPWIAAKSMNLSSHISGPTDALQQGSAITRTLNVEADGVPGMMLKEIGTPSIPGLAVYPDAADIKTTSNRGEIRGMRRERTTYIVQKPGRYQLPDVRLNWWNLETKQWEQAVAPSQILQTEGIAETAPLIQAVSPVHARTIAWAWGAWLIAGIIVVGGLAVCALVFKRGLPEGLGQWRLRQHMRKALASGKTMSAIRLFYQWYDQYSAGRQTPSVRDHAQAADFEALMEKGYADHGAEETAVQFEGIFSDIKTSPSAHPLYDKPFPLND
ncbi:MAG: hypothetical protein P1U50_06600 [Parvibaculaceae bacterium]|nr:hypothetical protein [Parvibaculaceae bacterium]